jgi:hypothetical protein
MLVTVDASISANCEGLPMADSSRTSSFTCIALGEIEGAGMIVVGSADYDRASNNQDSTWEVGMPWGTRQHELREMLLGGREPGT